MNIVVFKHGRLANIFDTVYDASIMLDVSEDRILKFIQNGKESSNGYSFDYPVAGIEYVGWGCEDERDIVV